MKSWVLYYKHKYQNDTRTYDINHYKVFIYKKDLANFLNKQDDTFFTIAIQKIDLSKSSILDKNYVVITNNYQKGGE